MKLCQKHEGLLTGDGECFQCQKDELHQVIIKLQMDVNLGNAVIIDQRRKLKQLEDQLQQK